MQDSVVDLDAEEEDGDEEDEGVHDDQQQQQSYNQYSMIAGTGIITRLSHLNNSHARQIVQTYLDYNNVPFSNLYSLFYFNWPRHGQNRTLTPA